MVIPTPESSPPVAAEEHVETLESKYLYTIRIAHYWLGNGHPKPAIDMLRNALFAAGEKPTEAVNYNDGSVFASIAPKPSGTDSALEVARKLVDKVTQRIMDFDDRTSPEDWPEALLITAKELDMVFTDDLAALITTQRNQVREEDARIADECFGQHGIGRLAGQKIAAAIRAEMEK